MVLRHILDRNIVAMLRRRCGWQSAICVCEAAVAKEFEETGCFGGVGVCGGDAGLRDDCGVTVDVCARGGIGIEGL